jgi:hypothetical protein
VLLAREYLSDLKGLAEQVDELWTHHALEDLVATVQQQLFTEEKPIAAVRPGESVAQGTKGVPWKKKGGKKPLPKESAQWRKALRRLVSASLTGSMVPLRRCATLLALVGKLRSQGQVNSVIPCCLLHIKEDIFNRCFLIGTGTSYSVFSYTSTLSSLGPHLKGSSGQLIWRWPLAANISLETSFWWRSSTLSWGWTFFDTTNWRWMWPPDSW